MAEVFVARNAAELADLTAGLFLAASQAAVQANGRFCVALSGGSTPLALYHCLCKPPFVEQIKWGKIHFFWGDERCVAPDHQDSNYNTARKAFLDVVPVQTEQIHRIEGEFGACAAAARYEHDLRTFFGNVSLPVFDLMFLGLGEDGHTASIFPDSPELIEIRRWTAAVKHAVPPPPLVDRVTLTLPVINAARKVAFLAVGADKAQIIVRILENRNENGSPLPAQLVQPISGTVTWYVDQEAYSFMSMNKPDNQHHHRA